MKFGVREICNVVFKARENMTIGKQNFVKGQPVLYIDTATTSSMEGASTAVYAQGGRGNTRLITWEGEKTLTFTVEDALLSPIGFAILSGAGVFNGVQSGEEIKVHAHVSESDTIGSGTNAANTVELKYQVDDKAPIFVLEVEKDGSITGKKLTVQSITDVDKTVKDENGNDKTIKVSKLTFASTDNNKQIFVDYYALKSGANVTELQISGDVLSGNYYVEADTLFRDQNTGKDMPAIITIPNAHIQSGFTFNMAATGDPSSFSFVMDAMPAYTLFDTTKKVLCVIQIVNDKDSDVSKYQSVMGHVDTEEYSRSEATTSKPNGEALDSFDEKAA